ncbi:MULTISPECIES: hemerythrin domain-containing protein [unclassified Streptomyces]|uniref:hemerythrin domain-containing protein n=1 Tax=unclassified Streptomyces TaxID=2593676 RepID=UPI000D6F8E72|nr:MULTISPECIES: hemerythrin domain-containing protein [unclassified Streptomyces]AWN30624.1 hemerythrin [Streptomyces sp. NEAU-S7GS2]
MGHGGDVVAELTADHREVDELFHQFEVAPPGSEARGRLVAALTIELVRHSVAEEQYLYPAVRKHLEGGHSLADKELADHARVEHLLKDLQHREPTDKDFDRLMVKLRTEVTAHVDDEENNLFPQMRSNVHAAVLEDLGDKIRQAKKTAPTRPHPAAPTTPPANKALAPGLGLVDRVRDYLSGRGQ